ncbi:MAG TPA: alkaline phosphatase family protein [Steroidobacteraceae bacterium]|nr:alkaline phosphatase family protein [Steroidobacteraceae bacterium]
MKTPCRALAAAALTACASFAAVADEGPVPRGVEPLDHVFLVMMENHGNAEVIGNPDMPFLNSLARHSALAANYFAVAHPSLTNYLEIVGGSNFGVLNDHAPDWHRSSCATNLSTGVPSLDESSYPDICPLRGSGTDAATPPIDNSNLEGNQPGPVINVDGKVGYPAEHTVALTLAHQLVASGRSWKAYEESLPPSGADGINSADGLFSNKNPPSQAGLTDGVVGLYAVKHNPFAYFADVEAGSDPRLSLARVVGFDGERGLFADLARGRVPNLVYIVPNQCNDQHGRSGAGPQCDSDPNDVGTLAGLNPGLMYQGDVALERIVTAIRSSQAWKDGRNAIVIVWDESDYSNAPITNQVTLVVLTNREGRDPSEQHPGRVSHRFYTHFSLLKSMEAGFGVPCLNNACRADVQVMDDLFDDRD